MQEWLKSGRLETLTPEQRRQLAIAAQLHEILQQNEELGKKRDDAKAFAQGLGVIIQANTDKTGVVNVDQLTRDIPFFSIDYESPFVNLSGSVRSNAAYNLLGDSRLGTIGWKEKYWDLGQQYQRSNMGFGKTPLNRYGEPLLRNQAHHFSYFFVETLKAKSNPNKLSQLKSIAENLELLQREQPFVGNQPDVDLANLAIDIGELVNEGRLSWSDLPKAVYSVLSDKY